MREEDNRNGKVSVSTFHPIAKNIYIKGTVGINNTSFNSSLRSNA